jgi:hypothetical protein
MIIIYTDTGVRDKKLETTGLKYHAVPRANALRLWYKNPANYMETTIVKQQ